MNIYYDLKLLGQIPLYWADLFFTFLFILVNSLLKGFQRMPLSYKALRDIRF